MENFNAGAKSHPPTAIGTQEGFTCLNDPSTAAARYTGCNVPTQYYEYHTNPQRWSDELRLVIQAGRPISLARRAVLGEDRGQEYRQHLLHARTANQGAAFQYYLNYNQLRSPSLPPGSGTPIPNAPITCRPPNSRTSASTSPISSTSKRAWCTFTPPPPTPALRPVCLRHLTPEQTTSESQKWDGKVRHQLQDHATR